MDNPPKKQGQEVVDVLKLIFAMPIGIVAWVALHMYYTNRGSGKLGFYAYFSGFGSAKRILIYIFALAGMVASYFFALRHQEPFVNCLRNELIFLWLFTIALIDLKEQKIPKALTVSGFLLWCVFVLAAVTAGGAVFSEVMFFSGGGLLLGGGLFFVCRLFSRGGVGMGDVRMFSILGLLYGMNDTFSILFMTILFMSVYGIVCAIMKKKDMKSMVAMGPFAWVACCFCFLVGI
jgi:Flp pilus assembly protein protease CpaA